MSFKIWTEKRTQCGRTDWAIFIGLEHEPSGRYVIESYPKRPGKEVLEYWRNKIKIISWAIECLACEER